MHNNFFLSYTVEKCIIVNLQTQLRENLTDPRLFLAQTQVHSLLKSVCELRCEAPWSRKVSWESRAKDFFNMRRGASRGAFNLFFSSVPPASTYIYIHTLVT